MSTLADTGFSLCDSFLICIFMLLAAGTEYPRISVRVGLVVVVRLRLYRAKSIFDVLTSLAIIYFSLEKELERNKRD